MANKDNLDLLLEVILEWFHTNYEDAVHGVFYNGRKGGYQYAPGAGPCDPLDVLRGELPEAHPAVLEEAADILRSSGSAWVKRGRY